MQSQADFTLVSRIDREEKIIAVTNWTAQKDKAVGCEPVHEGSVLGPLPLGAHGLGCIARFALGSCDGK